MKSTNLGLIELQESVVLARDGAQARIDEARDQADFADVFIAKSAQSQLQWLEDKSQEAPLTSSELEAEEVAPHLLSRVTSSQKQIAQDFDAQFIIEGDPVLGHAIDFNFFGQFLSSFQNTFNALGQWRTYNASAFGRVQQSIIDNNRLLLAATFDGSFGASVQIVSDTQEEVKSDGNIALFEDAETGEPEPKELPSDLLILLQQLLDGNADKATLAEALTQPRIKTHYQNLIELIAKRGADVKFSTRDQPQAVRISTEQARARLAWLENLQTKEDVQTFEGILVGGSIERNRFELKQAEELIEGRMTAEASRSFRRLSWGAEVRAIVQVTTSANNETATEKISYQLLGISLVTENLLRGAGDIKS